MHTTKKRILIVADKNEALYRWISSMLNKEFIVEETYTIPDWFKNLIIVFKKFKPDKILICGGALTSIWLTILLVRLFRLKIEIIVFRIDIENFRPYDLFDGFKNKLNHFIARKLEKFCLIMADKIIHKGLKNELEFLSFYDKIKNKPHYLFTDYLNPKLIQNYNPNRKLSMKDGQIHLVMVGSLALKKLPSTGDSIFEFYPKITNQKMHIHIYMKTDKETENMFRKIENENPFFHYHGYLSYEKLLSEIAKYDYGLFCTSWNRAKIKNFSYLITIFGNRVFDYITVHLPVIGSKDVTATANLIDKYKIGFNINQKDIYSLKETLIKNKQNYLKTVKNISKALTHFSNHKNFIKFIDS